MKDLLKYLIFLIVLTGCGDKKQQTSTEITIEMDKVIAIDCDSVTIKKLKYIPLEINSDVLIGQIDKMLVRNDRIFVADYHGSKSLFVFDMQGKFIFKINSFGRGPGEFLEFFDFNIAPSGEIYLWDVAQFKLIRYSSEGFFLSEKRLSYQFINFIIHANDGLYVNRLFKGGDCDCDLAHYDLLTDRIKKILPVTEKKLFDLPQFCPHYFYESPTGYCYIPRFSDIAYQIDHHGIIPYIHFANLPLPSRHTINEWTKDNKTMFMDMDHIWDLNSIYETDDLIAFVLEHFPPEQFLFHKKTGKCFHVIDLQKIGCSKIRACNHHTFFSFIEPDTEGVLDIIGSNSFKMNSEHPQLQLTEESNPIVVMLEIELP